MPSKKSTEILATAAASFTTLQQILDSSRESLSPEARRKLKEIVRKDTKKTRELLNGRRLRTTPESDISVEETECVLRLRQALDDLEEDVTEEVFPEKRAASGS